MFDLAYWMSFLGGFLQTYVFIICYNYTLEKRKIIITKDWVIMFFITIIVIFNNLYNNINLIMPVSIVMLAVLFYLLFQEKIVNLLCKLFFICVISMLVEFVSVIILSPFVTNLSNLKSRPVLSLFFTIINCYIFFFVFKSKLVLRMIKKVEQTLNKHKQLFFIGALILVIMISLSIIYSQNYHDVLFYTSSLSLIALLAFLLYVYFKQVYTNKLLELRSLYLEDNLDILKKTFNENKTLKHNIINDFLFVKTLCKAEDQKLIDEKMKKYYRDYEIIESLKNIPSGFQGLLYLKLQNASKYGISMSIDSKENFNYIDYKKMPYRKYIDLCDILGVLLDNAIEATKNIKTKVIYINSYEDADTTIIEIINTFNNEIDLNRIGDQNYSTKNRGSGIGLDYIKKLNQQIKIEKEIIQNLFKIKIIIKNGS